MVRLALAGAVGQARALEAVVDARALRLGLGCAAGLCGSHASPVGDPTILTEPADRGVIDRHTSTTAASGPGGALLEPAPRLRRPAPRVDPVGRCILGRSDVQVAREAPVRVVTQDVDRDGLHLAAGAVHDGKPKVALDIPISSASSRWLRSASRRARTM